RLGIALLPPFLDGGTGRAEDDTTARRLPGKELLLECVLHAVAAVGRRWSPVDHLRVGEGELRTRINRDDHAGHTAELLVRQKSCSLVAVDGDGDRGSTAAKRIARVEQTAIIAPRAGDKPGGSGSRFLTIVPEGRCGPDTILDVRIAAADDDLNLIR